MKINTSHISFIDMSDSRRLEVYITSNLPTIQIYDPDKENYTPDWTQGDNLKLTIDTFVDSNTEVEPEAIEWQKNGEKISGEFDKTLVIRENNTIETGIVTYTCKVTYQGLSAQAQIAFTRIEAGKQGADGKPTITAFLTNENVTFAANAAGVIVADTTFTTEVMAFRGDDVVTAAIDKDNIIIPNDITANVSENKITFTVKGGSNLGSDSSTNGTITIPVTSPASMNLQLTWSKINSGKDGVAPKMITLSTDSYVCKINQDNTVTPATITITPYLQGYPDNHGLKWRFYNGVDWVTYPPHLTDIRTEVDDYTTTHPTDSTRLLTYCAPIKQWSYSGENPLTTSNIQSLTLDCNLFAQTGKKSLPIRLSDGNDSTIYDVVTIYNVVDGANAKIVKLQADTQVIKINADETISPETITVAPICLGFTPTSYEWTFKTDVLASFDKTMPSGIKIEDNQVKVTCSDVTASSVTIKLACDGVSDVLTLYKAKDGDSYYTWIKYADDNQGNGMSDTPTATSKYIGIAYNQTSQIESLNFLDYTWSLIQGDAGVNGKDGTTYYTWIKYADNSDGEGISNDPSGKKYIGIAYNKDKPESDANTEANNPLQYQWSLIKGSDGIDGTSPALAFLTNENITFAADVNGEVLNTTFTTNVVAYSGNTKELATIGNITNSHNGITASQQQDGDEQKIIFTIDDKTLGSVDNINGTIQISITSPLQTTLSLTWSKIKSVAGEGAKSIALHADQQIIKIDANQQVTPSTITFTPICQNVDGDLTWQYKYDDVDDWQNSYDAISTIDNIATLDCEHCYSNWVSVKVSNGDIYDIITIYKVYDGEPTSFVFLSNENITFAANSSGQVAATEIPINVSAYIGSIPQKPTLGAIAETDLPTGMRVKSISDSADGNEQCIILAIADNATFGSVNSCNGIVNIPIISPIQTTKQLTWSKVNSGKDGTGAITLFLTNENVTFAANAAGVIVADTTFTTEVMAFRGDDVVTAAIDKDNIIIPNDITANVSENKITFTVKGGSNLGSDSSTNGTITIPVTSPASMNLQLTWSKINSGVEGASPKRVTLATNSHIFKAGSDGGVTPSTITITPSVQGFTDEKFKWRFITNEGTSWVTNPPAIKGGEATDEYSYEVFDNVGDSKGFYTSCIPANQWNALTFSVDTLTALTIDCERLLNYGCNSLSIKLTYNGDEIYDVLTIHKVSDGEKGEDGITFQIYAPYGTVLQEDVEELELMAFAYSGSTLIEDATYQWSKIDFNGMDWIETIVGTTSSITAVPSDVSGSQTYKCIMTYNGQIYTDTIDVLDKNDVFTVKIDPHTGVAVQPGESGLILSAYVCKNGEIVLDKENNSVAIDIRGSITTDISTEWCEETRGDYYYYINTEDNTVTCGQVVSNGNNVYYQYGEVNTHPLNYDYTWSIVGQENVMLPFWGPVVYIPKDYIHKSAVLQCIVKEKVGEDESEYELCSSQIALFDINDPITSTTAPTQYTEGMIWVDTSSSPPIIKICVNVDGEYQWQPVGTNTHNFFTSIPDDKMSDGYYYHKEDLWMVSEEDIKSLYGNTEIIQPTIRWGNYNTTGISWTSSSNYLSAYQSIGDVSYSSAFNMYPITVPVNSKRLKISFAPNGFKCNVYFLTLDDGKYTIRASQACMPQEIYDLPTNTTHISICIQKLKLSQIQQSECNPKITFLPIEQKVNKGIFLVATADQCEEFNINDWHYNSDYNEIYESSGYLRTMQNSFSFDEASGVNIGTMFSDSSSVCYINIRGDKITFYTKSSNGTEKEVSSIDNDKLNTPEAEIGNLNVTKRFRFGNFGIIQEVNGSISIVST